MDLKLLAFVGMVCATSAYADTPVVVKKTQPGDLRAKPEDEVDVKALAKRVAALEEKNAKLEADLKESKIFAKGLELALTQHKAAYDQWLKGTFPAHTHAIPLSATNPKWACDTSVGSCSIKISNNPGTFLFLPPGGQLLTGAVK